MVEHCVCEGCKNVFQEKMLNVRYLTGKRGIEYYCDSCYDRLDIHSLIERTE